MAAFDDPELAPAMDFAKHTRSFANVRAPRCDELFATRRPDLAHGSIVTRTILKQFNGQVDLRINPNNAGEVGLDWSRIVCKSVT
jgi:hypothetical protein